MRTYYLLFLITLTFFSSCVTAPGGPIIIVNGKKAEKAIAKDAIPPTGYNALTPPKRLLQSGLNSSILTLCRLDSYNARINSNEGSITYNFYDPASNNYLSDLNKKSIISIRLVNDSLSCKVLNYKFTQTIDGKRNPMSISFVLDHSGSMGDERANILQEALHMALDSKHVDDEISIFKFDDKVNKLINSKDKNALKNTLMPTSGLNGYGYTTSIQDAIKLAIDEQNKSSLKEKMIVILTDGIENSSFVATDLVALVTEAKKSKIVINTLGFGEYIDQEYLLKISQETGGDFRQLFSKNEIANIFNHTMFKINYNFKVNFSPCMFGDSLKLITMVKLGDSTYTNERLVYSPFSLGESIELNVLFDADKYNIKKEYEAEVKGFINFLILHPNVDVEIAGHTDSSADDKHNLKLSQNRALEIKKYMEARGIASKRITTIGYGETKLKYPDDSDENKALNRRIEVKIIGN